MRRWRGTAIVAAMGLCGIAGACSAANGGGSSGNGVTPEDASGPGTGSASSGGFGFGGSADDPSAGAGGDSACAGERSAAERVQLDMYIMLDASGSMKDETATGESKWDAVTGALEAFFTNSEANDLNAGLQYFPIGDSNTLGSLCTSDADCGGTRQCSLPRACSDGSGFGFCTTDADCAAGATCEIAGNCSTSFFPCTNIGGNCTGDGGTCTIFFPGNCLNAGVCDVARYEQPEVEIASLQTSAASLVASMRMKEPEGGTPTAAALSGALQHAQEFAAANPTHKVVAVLVTDGLPSACSPQDAAGLATLAEQAATGATSVSTFTIGVFGSGDSEGRETVDAIARSGGTTSAFIVDPTQNVSEAFLDALTAIRGQTLACEYLIPNPADGQSVDFNKVNVEHTPEGVTSASTLYYVPDAAACDPMTGGWHYDVDPRAGGDPTKIVICPASCEVLKKGGEIAISVGCKTETQIPL